MWEADQQRGPAVLVVKYRRTHDAREGSSDATGPTKRAPLTQELAASMSGEK
jgi:hypothetical protein